MDQHLIFTIGKTKYAIASREVLRLIEVAETTKIPFMPKGCLGLASISGEIFAIYDAGYLLSDKYTEITPNSKIVLLTRNKLGLLVEKVEFIFDVQEETIKNVTVTDSLKERIVMNGEDIIVVLSIEELIVKMKPVEEVKEEE